MTLKIGCGLTVFRLLTLCELTLSAMVLPRPPSSPNDIPQETILTDTGKFRNDKALYSRQSVSPLITNVEKPNTDGYRLLEIELRGSEDVGETSLQDLVRAMLSEVEHQQQQPELTNESDTYPNLEVVPHSILGVRDIGLSLNYRIHPFVVDQDKRTLLRPPNNRSPDEKFYYLKNTRPKVDVNVRGRSGSFTGDTINSKTVSDRSSILRPPGSYEGNTKSLLDKRIRRPKKYQSSTSQKMFNNNNYSTNGANYATSEFEPKPDRDNDESTTENMIVTSSELPKQIPAPPSWILSRLIVAQTTPVQKYTLRRTDILPGYTFGEA